MINPGQIEVPDEAEPTHVALVEAVGDLNADVKQDVEPDVIFTVEVDGEIVEDGVLDDFMLMPMRALLIGREPEEFWSELMVVKRKLDPELDAELRRYGL